MGVVPFYYTALHCYQYHKGNNLNADPKWADKYLVDCVLDRFLTQDEADSIKQSCGEAVQKLLFSNANAEVKGD
jgi:hypothetical protein